MIHYISATAINTKNGVKHLAFCGAQLDYYHDSHLFTVYSVKNVTCLRCVVEYAKIYPQEYKTWAATERGIRAENAAGITYDWKTGEFSLNGKLLSDEEYIEVLSKTLRR